MSILVDSSIWIDYFRNTGRAEALDLLIDENLVVVNDLILAELIPPLHVQKRKEVIALLREIERQTISIDWDELLRFQIICLTNGINEVGIPDLIIAQNALQGRLQLMSNDNHFSLLSRHFNLQIYR